MASRDDLRRIADEHDLSQEAVAELARALERGNGRQAQFNHPDLGGQGQWMAGGMTQVGDMFNNDLKARVDAACRAIADAGTGVEEKDEDADDREAEEDRSAEEDDQRRSGGDWWPDDLGSPSSTGGQNDSAYAVFPDARRLAVKAGGDVRVYDTGDHRIQGVSQQQGSIEDTRFSTAGGDTIRVGDLDEV